MERPQKSEYNSYYESYINKVINDDVVDFLEVQLQQIISVFNSIPPEKENYFYAEGKWSIKEVLGHITDTERIFAYRALCISRGEKKPLPGFEQDDYISTAKFSDWKFLDLIEEFKLLRESNILLFKNFQDESISNIGTVSGNAITVRAILFIIAGHAEHHIDIIRKKYLL